ncbi:hypothetical protein PUR61_02460 [Streptomyces sp. BE20]|uniref:hypothetical protein n=1 Tax=Streptomyces sp. BE20 TaxID=3002525 RepID=UPI002E7A217F|nr:hypothetical protein [Streptomyces sp. BE20]MEE1821068.1 hypothetical protein [Streptomyces sp. BE20]
MAGNTPQAEALRTLYRGDDAPDEEQCRHAAKLIEQSGAREWTLRRARRHSADALHRLALAEPRPLPAAELTALAHLVTQREH